ncbi:MAG: hypothetical protein ACTSPF_12585 [Candidatus Heimdallarchaeaceae archaeon]
MEFNITVTVNSIFVLKALGCKRWQIRKIGHMILFTVAAFFPYFFNNLFDIYVSVLLALGLFLFLSAIPQVQYLQRIFKMCSREERNPWELFFNSIFTSIILLVFLWFFKDEALLFIFTAAYLTMSLGDGLGEMIGRPFGRIKYKIFSEKSLEGSLAVFVGTAIAVTISLAVNSMIMLPGVWWKILVTAVVGAIVEALSYKFLDNATLPGITALMLYLLFVL